MRVLVTGGIAVLGRVLLPLLEAAGHENNAPNLRTRSARRWPSRSSDRTRRGVYHLAMHLPARNRMGDREAWRENDRLRADASRLLVDAALAAAVDVYVVPTVTFGAHPGTRISDAARHLRALQIAMFCGRARGQSLRSCRADPAADAESDQLDVVPRPVATLALGATPREVERRDGVFEH